LNNRSITRWVKGLEVGLVIGLLFFADSLQIPRVAQVLVSLANYLLVFFVVFFRGKRLLYVANQDWHLLGLVGLAVLSVLWSGSSGDTENQIKLLLRSVLFGAYLALEYSPKQLTRMLSWAALISIGLCTVVTLAVPQMGLQSINGGIAWQGIYTHKQTLGSTMAFFSSLFLVQLLDKQANRGMAVLGLLGSVLLVLLSASKTGLMMMLFLVALLPLYKVVEQQGAYRAFLLFFSVIFVSVLITVVAFNLETIVVGYLGKDLELNGRVPVWNMAIEKGMERPWLGYGYEGFWTSDQADMILANSWAAHEPGFKTRSITFHAHNGFIDVFLQMGGVGLVLLALSFFSTLARVINLVLLTRKPEYFWMFLCIGIFLISNFTEGLIILSANQRVWVMYVAISFSTALEQGRVRRSPRLRRVRDDEKKEMIYGSAKN
jgi:exopolysaccharide production protein ExoQ